MDDSFRRGAALRGPMNDANRNSGRFEVVDADAVQATYVNGCNSGCRSWRDEEEEDKRSVTGNGLGPRSRRPNERYAGQDLVSRYVWRYY
jgi:hypothetical protein